VVALLEILWAVYSFLRPRGAKFDGEQAGEIIDAGSVAGFAPNSVTAFPRGQFYLVCLQDGGLMAISRRCTHLGCSVPWVADQEKFICPCHASTFDIRGEVLQSPALRAMDLFAVTIENNRVYVHTSALTRRGSFRKEQVAYPKAV
jgi:Rieske Fe-S protein